MRRFLDLSGLEADQVRAAAERPAFFVDLLDFYLASEDDVVDLASQLRVPPGTIGRAWNELAAKAGIEGVDYPA